MTQPLQLGISSIAFAATMIVAPTAQAQDDASATDTAANRSEVQTADADADTTVGRARSGALSADDTGIIVTAQRRAENVQDAALAISAVSGDRLDERGITSATRLNELTPGLAITPSIGPYVGFAIRGVSNISANAFSDPSTAVNLAGVYLASPAVGQGLFYDLERVEILKGPQGTLYGRNATGGAVNVIPRRPQIGERGADLALDVGNYSRINANAAINLPLSSGAAARLAVQSVHRDGFYSDGTGDEKVQAGRLSVLAKPAANLRALFIADYANQGGKGPGSSVRRICADATPCFPLGAWTGVQDSGVLFQNPPTPGAPLPPQTRDTYNENQYWGIAANIDWDVLGGTFTIIPAYREADVKFVSTVIGATFMSQEQPEQYSLEARYAYDAQWINVVVGGYYLQTETHARTNGEQAAARVFSDQFINNKGYTYAAFTQGTVPIVDSFRLTAGIRYSHEQKETDSIRYNVATVGPSPVIPLVPITPPTGRSLQENSWDNVSWTAGFEWNPREDSLVFGNVRTGFKAGGFFFGVPGNESYEPEGIIAYTLGTKNSFFDRRLIVNLELFQLDYKDQQLTFVQTYFPPPLFNAPVSVVSTENIGTVLSRGFELEAMVRPFSGTRIGGQLQYLNSKYEKFTYDTPAPPVNAISNPLSPTTNRTRCNVAGPFPRPIGPAQFTVDCSGQQALRAPEWTFIAHAQHEFLLPAGESVQAEVRMRYESAFEADANYYPELRTFDTTRFDVALTYRMADDISVQAYVENITDVKTIAAMYPSNAYARLLQSTAVLQPPRTFGVRLRASF